MAELRLGVAVLAAGASRRFGDTDKLTALLDGQPLGEIVCNTIPRGMFDHRWVIASVPDHPCAPAWRAEGFTPLVNPSADEGMGTSVALAGFAAKEAGCDALLLALADMPLVPVSHFEALVDQIRAGGAQGIVTSASGETRMPPAAFGASHLSELAGLSGDQGARALLQRGDVLACPPEWLADVDTPEALAALNARIIKNGPA
ncbi:MAG: nucleotidyltransferase family protein [Pseudomonadota bacterium]